ncbi:bifunctional (p)ppGpp synthetase/guanosine-3',5'-bis(diphosphate) 3'-pyrophosphohydrolase [Streptomyces sp. A1136]|uniref:RelA/SpoT family protein n=1 Tax=Streptomyces sp. A1136 TaxID=2563102 RepID=UPI00109E70BC|nr:HD domain-containing protein [Streptomyces sp. A1136]THA57169.1 bifunctional (p)ppGpp synthetase/guanosine-3',5'-bis(diphosphate) 3'-pyrophosphohydrolase [Streptomyces sp. A1136]
MSAEATNPEAHPEARPELRRRSRTRLDLRRLGRAALLGPPSRDRLPDAIGHVAEAHRAHHPDADLSILRRAYLLAETSHRGQMRKSGEPYITHPLAVTLILAELGAETTTLTASLLHDTVEDTEVTLEQVRAEFGDEVCFIVDGVTKVEKIDYGAAAEPETFRKMLVATGNDVRVMSIKLADRLHNMRTLGVMRPDKQARIAKVTRDVLIPLAERLGVQALKTELEDLVFAILHPEEYEHTRALIAAHAGENDPLPAIADSVRAVLRDAGIAAEVVVRPRHFVSVHRISRTRGELRGSDFGRILVLVAENADCYGVLGELHTCFTPVVSEFKDFIAVPKFNLYQSLHTAVATPDGHVAEVIVRTRQMHRVAEAGVVALGNPYTTGEAADSDEERVDPTRPGWLSRLLDWQQSAPDPDTFWTVLRAELAQDREITVFGVAAAATSPRALTLPAGASCIDAAYAQYGEAAHGCIGARVNGRLTSLSSRLRDGDTVQPLLAHDASSGPAADWLDHATTPAARIAISSWLEAHPDGAAATTTAAARAPLSVVGARGGGGNAVADLPNAHVRLAGCCTPVPPDAVAGFVVRGGAVTVHRVHCPAVAQMRAVGRTSVAVHWRATADCRVTLVAESFGRPHLLADLTEAIAREGVEVVSATVEAPVEQRVRHTYTLQLPDAAGLPALMRAMRDVAGVYDVSRA